MATKIMPVGDSLTSVTWTEGGVEKYALGYKGYLYNALDDAGHDIDYVGPRTAGQVSGQRDPHHAAWEGRETSHFQPLITGYMQTFQPQVVHIMLGTNDVWSNRNITTSLANLRDIVSKVYAANQSAHVVLCTIARMNTGQQAAWEAYNTGVRTMVAEFKAAGRRVTLADVATLNVALQGDGVHWTTAGHQMVATYLKPIYDTVLGSATDTWMSGQSGVGAADGTFAAWVGGSYVTEIAGAWADAGPVEQAEVYEVAGGALRNFSRPVDVAVGAIFKDRGETWAAAAAGAYDARWATMWQTLATARAGKSTTYVRFAHEFSLSYFPWSVLVGEEANFKAAWVRLKNLRDTHFPAAKLVWCPNDGADSALDIRNCYPGEAYVDVHGVDSYNAYGALNTTAAILARFNATESHGAPRGLNTHLVYAQSKGKPLAICEWSSASNSASPYNGQDAPVYMQFFWDWLVTNGAAVEYEILFNVAGYSQGYQLYPTNNQPLAAAKYRGLWATKSPAPLGDTPTEQPPTPQQPAGQTLFAADFTGTNGAALPAALVPGLTNGGATGVINGNQGRITTGSSAYGAGQFSRRITLATPTADSQQCITYTRRGASGAQELWLGARAENNLEGANGYYLVAIPELKTWGVYRVTNYGRQVLGTTQTLDVGVDVPIRFCFRVVGASIMAKAWTGATEPAWQIQAADTTYSQPGAIGFMVRAGAAASVADLDDYLITDGSSTPAPDPEDPPPDPENPTDPGGGNQPPFIRKGADFISVPSGGEFTIAGWSAGDPEQQPVMWSWSAGLGVVVSGGNSASPTMRAPFVDEPQVYEVVATVVDPHGGSATAVVIVSVGAQSLLASRNADGSLTYYRLVAVGAAS